MITQEGRVNRGKFPAMGKKRWNQENQRRDVIMISPKFRYSETPMKTCQLELPNLVSLFQLWNKYFKYIIKTSPFFSLLLGI